MAMSRFERQMREYEVLLEALKTSIIVSEQGLKWYKDNANIEVGDKKVSLELLKRLLTDEDYYEYVEKLFNNEIDKYRVNAIVDLEESKDPITLSKVEIVKGIKICLNRKLFKLDELGEARLEELEEKLNFKLFEKEVLDDVFSIVIDGEKFEVSTNNLLSFLTCSDEEYEEFFDLAKEQNIYGIPKDKFAFVVVKFVDYCDIFSKYLVPDKIVLRCDELSSSKRIDIQAMNEIEKTYAPNLDKVVVDSRLRKKVLDGLPSEVSDLEKAAYIYIKMCKMLVYDDEFYAFGMRGNVKKKHENIKNLANINIVDNKVVCYEFNAIYAKFLNELGIKFEMNVNPFREFGGGHANLEFRDGKFLVKADAVVSILNGDLTRAKLNQVLNGFVCLNNNSKTKEEFKEKVTKMYELVVKQEKEKLGDKSKPEVEKSETFDDIVLKYKKMTSIKKINLDDKFKILVDKANGSNLYKIDVFAYMLQLKKIIFSESEQQKNIMMSIVKKSFGGDSATVNMILALNNSGFDENVEQTLYYIHNGDSLRTSSKEELDSWFDLGLFAYIDDDDPRVPGIEERRKRGQLW